MTTEPTPHTSPAPTLVNYPVSPINSSTGGVSAHNGKKLDAMPVPPSPTKASAAPFAATNSGRDPEKGHAEYEGEGTADSPFVIKYAPDDPSNPMTWSPARKWLIVANAAIATLVVAFGSSIYAGGARQITGVFGISQELFVGGLSLYVLGFAVGPLLWAPFSELYGRRYVFIGTYAPFVLFNLACALAKNVETLLVCRFFAGFFGASPLTNSGGIIADLFDSRERALALSLFALAPFAGPVLGPIVGGYLGMSASWTWLFWLLTIFSGIFFFLGLLIPETYAPVLLRRRARKLSTVTGQHFVSVFDLRRDANETLAHTLKVNMTRPFVLLFLEPIVLLFSIYAAFVYGTLYLMFGAFPIVFVQERGWSTGAAGLPFIGIGIGMLIGIIINTFVNKKYVRDLDANGGSLPPEARLPICCFGGVCLPVGLFWFAWTVQPSVHWIVPCLASVPFGLGMVLVFLSMMSFFVDSYLMYAASALAANAVLRSIFGAVFPLFTRYMFEGMGTNWALTLLAFVSLALTPVPFFFYRYGARIRARSSFAPGHKPAQLSKAPSRNEQDLAEEIREEDEFVRERESVKTDKA